MCSRTEQQTPIDRWQSSSSRDDSVFGPTEHLEPSRFIDGPSGGICLGDRSAGSINIGKDRTAVGRNGNVSECSSRHVTLISNKCRFNITR